MSFGWERKCKNSETSETESTIKKNCFKAGKKTTLTSGKALLLSVGKILQFLLYLGGKGHLSMASVAPGTIIQIISCWNITQQL